MNNFKPITQQTFSERFKSLTGNASIKDICAALNMKPESEVTIGKWRCETETSGIIPEKKNIYKICEVYDCDPNFLMLEDDQHINMSDREISKITGLSDKSIEVLREIQENKSAMPDGGRAFGVLTDDYSLRTIDLINYVLEEQYEWAIEHKMIRSEIKAAAAKGKKELRQLKIKPLQPLYTVFTGMYNAIFGDDAICTADKKNIKPIMESVTDQLDSIYYYDEFSRAAVSADTKELWQTYNTNKVITWINNHRDRKNNKK